MGRMNPFSSAEPTESIGRKRGYDAKKERERSRNAAKSRSGRDIGELPPVADPERRERCRIDPELYLRTYFPHRFKLPFSRDHRELIATAEEVILGGGQHAYAMARGSGKTTIAECLTLRATSYGLRFFAVLVGASKPHASGNLESLKTELETNDLLLADFPEICFPIRRLEGIANRAKGQLYKGQPTRIGWTKDRITFPTIPGSLASGATIRVTGIGGGLRGMKLVRPLTEGDEVKLESIRPDLAIIDDPQTDASAASPSQCETRERLIDGAILGLAGPASKIAALCPCTVIRRGDVADRLTDRKVKPDWLGVRKKLVYEWPVRADLWEQYADLRTASLENGGDGREATDFYKANRAEMDRGAQVGWAERHNADEVSAIQHAYNLKLRNPYTFDAEYQNDPSDLTKHAIELDADEIATRLNGLEEGKVALAATTLVAMIDVQHNLLYWAASAVARDFATAVPSYGSWPKQSRDYFTHASAKQLLVGNTKEERIAKGLGELLNWLFSRVWQREDGTPATLDRVGVDASDGQVAETIRAVCRTHPHAARITPCVGKGIGPDQKPLHQYNMKPGDKVGHHWLYQRTTQATRDLTLDSNYWKSALADRLTAEIGGAGALTFYGRAARTHRMISEHLVSEQRDVLRSEKADRSCDVWTHKPGRPDNHLWDCLVGCQALANFQGVSLPGQVVALPPSQRRRKHSISF